MDSPDLFARLHEGVKRWIWAQDWKGLRGIQQQAIEPIMAADRDVVICASTAGGKTEAAFLPALSRVADDEAKSVCILYVSPLKSLINDQYRRLESLCAAVDLPLTAWHGDASQTAKAHLRKRPRGVLLITPESIESLLMNRASWCLAAFADLRYVIIDEFHAFLGTPRCYQLLSQLHRIEFMLQRAVPRIALSATLGDISKIAGYLRPNGTLPSKLIVSDATDSALKLQIRSYLDEGLTKSEASVAIEAIKDDLFRLLRGKSNLIFANSRARTEDIAFGLTDRCEFSGVPNEFFPHHGSLSKEWRESIEARLLKNDVPTSAVCTMTLELGIDIGPVDSIAQIEAPHSVSSLRQRLGRSGRRNNAAVLRIFLPASKITEKSHPLDALRLQIAQSIAMINLLLRKSYEPPLVTKQWSTLVQQILSVVAQYGGMRATKLWNLLCATGPFTDIEKAQFAVLLRSLGAADLLAQSGNGELILGCLGERLIEHHSFFVTFRTPEEYTLECAGKPLGTLPIDQPLLPGQHVIFAGRRWEVISIEPDTKRIVLIPGHGGAPPCFGGERPMVHDMVRREMLAIYQRSELPSFLDHEARSMFTDALQTFRGLQLDRRHILEADGNVLLLPWLGDRTVTTICFLLRTQQLDANSFSGAIEVNNCSSVDALNAMRTVIANGRPNANQLATLVADTIVDKFDMYVPKELRAIAFGEKYFDVEGAWKWITDFVVCDSQSHVNLSTT